MAMNIGRYVTTGGYMNPDGTIVEETQWVPEGSIETIDNLPHFHTQNTVFSPTESLKLRADGYYDRGETALGDAYSALWDGANSYGSTANQINNFYNVLANDLNNREALLAGEKYNLANQLNQDLLSQKDYVMEMFGPNGVLTNEINTYYDDLGNYLATDAGRQAAKIAAQGMHSGASIGSIRAQQNEAYNESFERYIKAKEQEINAKQTIASNLITYMSTLRKEYGETTNKYIIEQYQRANDLLNEVSKSIAKANIELAGTKLKTSIGGGRSSSSGFIIPDSVRTAFYNGLTDEQKKIFDSYSQAQRDNLIVNWYYGDSQLNNTSNEEDSAEDVTDVIINSQK